MSPGESTSRELERAKALVCRRMFNDQSALLTVGQYELVRTLGRGGMGTVYEAFDRTRQVRVALKMLRVRSPVALYRLKQEFRTLAELNHPGLVSLHELCTEEHDAYITMELVDGSDFVSYVREGVRRRMGVPDERKLRSALHGLFEGIKALHTAGKLHRDLKPSNVLVTSSGRVVLLDFGLAHDANEEIGDTAGTPEYMAPEQARGHACISSDWYSFGRILEEALYGKAGWARRARNATDSSFAEGPYAELAQLAWALLDPEPWRRPTAEQIRAVLGEPECERTTDIPRPSERRVSELFVGRARELEQLRSAFVQSRTKPLLLLIRGESGIGKSTLVTHFVQSELAATSALVLRGRCYERESVPYKVLDSVIDELSRHLIASPPVKAGLSRAETTALLHVFPVLGRVPELQAADGEARELKEEGVHPVERRRRGFAALSKLIRSLAAKRPLVLCIDDVQWSDQDSGQLLGALLCDAESPPMMIIGSDRTDPCLINPAIGELRRFCSLALHEPPLMELELGPLDRQEALTLSQAIATTALPRASVAQQTELATLLAANSQGNPMFLSELWRSAVRAPGNLQRGVELVSLETLIEERLATLSKPARAMVDFVAVAGRPVAATVVAHAAGLSDQDAHASVIELRRARLAHAVRRNRDDLLEIDHDRISMAVLFRLSRDARQRLHARLARALESVRSVHSECLVDEYIAADLPIEAGRHARHAGHLAFAALAFSRAAGLYQMALQLGRWSTRERAELHVDLARALEHSGSGLDAALAYRRAAEACESPFAAAKLEQRAAEHLMYNGRHAEGQELLARCYEAHGLFWPRSKLALILAILLLALQVALGRRRGARKHEALHRERAAMLGAAGSSLEVTDSRRAVYNALLSIREAERVDDPAWHARALGARGIMRCAGFTLGNKEGGLRVIEAARQTASDLGDATALSELEAQLAYGYLSLGKGREALASANRFEASVRSLPSAPPLLYSAMGLIGMALLDLGELREVARRWPAFIDEARRHGDFMAVYWIHAHPAQFAVLNARNDRTGAEAILGLQRQMRRRHPEFPILAWMHAVCSIESELYWGSAETAETMMRADASTLRGGDGYVVVVEATCLLAARVLLGAAAAQREGRARSRLTARARASARKLRSSARPGIRGAGRLAEAGAASLRGNRKLALKRLHEARALLHACESKLVAATADYVHGALTSDAAGEARMRTSLAVTLEEGIVDPYRWMTWNAPAFGALFAERRGNSKI